MRLLWVLAREPITFEFVTAKPQGVTHRLSTLRTAAGAADKPVQEIKINGVHIHANPLAGA